MPGQPLSSVPPTGTPSEHRTELADGGFLRAP